MIKEKILPNEWKLTKMEEVCDIISGKNQSKVINPKGKYPIYGSSGIFGFADEYLCNEGTTVIGRKGTINSPQFVKTKFWNVDTAFGLSPKENYDNKLLYYFCLSFNFHKLDKSTTIPSLAKRDLLSIDIPLPPKPTQQAIVSKIEELFSELDKGIENLHIAQQQLKTYRQSVLKWAFEGKLTNENVKEGELPKGWKLTKLGEYIEDISSGKSYRCDERPPKNDEIGIVKVSSVTWGFFDEMESKTCFSKDFLNEKYLIKKENFLFSRANTIEFIGACVIVHKIDKILMLSDKILRFTFSKDVSKEYALYYLRSRKGRKQIETLSTRNQDSMRNIGQEKIKQIEFPYCSIKEQRKIAQEIESRLSVADKIEESITQSLQQAEALRQSILKKAFEGRLI
jgi:type I restriction enzyme S subunit